LALLWLPSPSWRAGGVLANIRARLRERRQAARGEGGEGQRSGRDWGRRTNYSAMAFNNASLASE